MKEKHVEERFPRYFIFGSSYPGKVDVCTVNETVATVTKEEAEDLVQDRKEAVDMIVRLAQRLNQVDSHQFKSLWYVEA